MSKLKTGVPVNFAPGNVNINFGFGTFFVFLTCEPVQADHSPDTMKSPNNSLTFSQ